MVRTMSFLLAPLALIFAPLLHSEEASSRDPSIYRPVTTREIEQLRRDLLEETRSNIQGIMEYHSESGDLNNRLDYWRYGGAVNYRLEPGMMVYLRGTRTQYITLNDDVREHGLNLTVGVNKDLAEATKLQLEVGATRFSTDEATVNALGSLKFQLYDKLRVYLTGSRTNVEESLLSAAGIRPAVGPFAGRLVGQVMDNRGVIGGSLQLLPRLDLFAEVGGGTRTGRNIESNPFRLASGGAGYNIFTAGDQDALSLVRASYSLNYLGFDKNLFGFGGASLTGAGERPLPRGLIGADGGFTGGGLGGYFSPARYVSNQGRVELRGRPNTGWEYHLSGFLGSQNYTGSGTRLATGFSGTVTLHVTDRFSLPVTFLRDNLGPFTQQSLFVTLIARL